MSTIVQEPPEFLYKYMNPGRAASFFSEPTIRYTPPKELNDPYDSSPVCDITLHIDKDRIMSELKNINGQDIPRMIDTIIDILCEDNTVFGKEVPGNAPFVSHLRTRVIYFFWVYARLEIKAIDPLKYVLHRLDIDANKKLPHEETNFGVLSLSESNNSPKMWNFYCDDHKGVVIELKSRYLNEATVNDSVHLKLRKVDYDNERQRVSLPSAKWGSKQSDADAFDHMTKTFFKKSKEWEHEKEYRQIKHLFREFDQYIYPETGKKAKEGVAKLPVDTINGVILGMNDKGALEPLAREFVRKHNHICLQQAQRNTDGYEMIIKCLET